MRRLLEDMEREKCAKVTFEENRSYAAVCTSSVGILRGVTITCKNLIQFTFSLPGRALRQAVSFGTSALFRQGQRPAIQMVKEEEEEHHTVGRGSPYHLPTRT